MWIIMSIDPSLIGFPQGKAKHEAVFKTLPCRKYDSISDPIDFQRLLLRLGTEGQCRLLMTFLILTFVVPAKLFARFAFFGKTRAPQKNRTECEEHLFDVLVYPQ